MSGAAYQPSRDDLHVLLGGMILALTIALGCLHYAPFTIDDAYISFRYALHTAAGHGPVFNPGDRVEGVSNLPWVLLLAPLAKAGFELPRLAKLLGSLALLATALTIYGHALRRDTGTAAAVAAAAACGFAPAALVWAVGGLETTAYALLIGLGAVLFSTAERPPLASATVFGLAAAMRPEAVCLIAAPAAVLLFDLWRAAPGERRRRGWMVLCWLALAITPLAALTLFRALFYGSLFPNTFYIKARTDLSLIRAGWSYLTGAAGRYHLWALIPLWLWLARGRAAAFFAGLLAIQIGVLVVVGGDWMPAHRFIVPLLPTAALLTTTALARGRGVRRALAVAVAAAMVASWYPIARRESTSTRHYAAGLERSYVALGRRLAAEAPPDARLGMLSVGATPYYSGLYTLDLLGLNDAYIARQRHAVGLYLHQRPAPPELARVVRDYVFAQELDFLVLTSSKPTTDGITSFIHYGLLEDPRWSFVADGPGLRFAPGYFIILFRKAAVR